MACNCFIQNPFHFFLLGVRIKTQLETLNTIIITYRVLMICRLNSEVQRIAAVGTAYTSSLVFADHKRTVQVDHFTSP